MELPNVIHLKYQDPPEGVEGETVQFRLVYRGKLPAASGGKGGTRVPEKHAIRRQIHKQLRELWNQNSLLSRYFIASSIPDPNTGVERTVSALDSIADRFARCGFRFVPLIKKEWGIACSLDVLFLRRDGPGNLIRSGGDLDNRMNVLFDALKVPAECGELPPNQKPEDGEDPFFCLLEDDKLITDISITTDKLLVPPESDEPINDVVLVMLVKTVVVNSEQAFTEFYS